MMRADIKKADKLCASSEPTYTGRIGEVRALDKATSSYEKLIELLAKKNPRSVKGLDYVMT